MRNLKRVLSLAMAALMLMGMMVVSAGAASTYDSFTDKDEIVNTEAVNTMVSLGVLAGKPDGDDALKFDPTATVTRGEMAKIIAVSLNGGKEPVLGNSTNLPKFSDVSADHWAYNYIAYCVQLNIIAGRGDGTFDPDAAVTGSEAAKMYLCALGYRADLEGLTGNEWELNTNVLANQDAKLYEGLESINPSEGLTRDNTAQMCYNAVQAQEVKYENLQGSYEDVLQTVEQGTMLTNRFKVVKVTGIAMANDKMSVDDAVARDGKTRLDGITVPDFTATQIAAMGNVFTVDTPDDMIGQEIVLYVRFVNDLAPNAASATVVGEPILTDTNVVYETSAKLADAQKVRDALKTDGLKVDTVDDDNGITQTVFFGETGTKLNNDGNYPFGVVGTAGMSQRFIDNDNDGVVEYIIQELPGLSKVTSINTAGEKISFYGNVGTQDFEDVIGYEDLAKDDFVLVISYDDVHYYVSKPETVEGTVTAYDSDNVTISIDGTAYSKSEGFVNNIPGLSSTGMEQMVGDDYILYLNENGKIMGYAFVEAALSNLAVVVDSGVTTNALGAHQGEVKLVLADGTTATYSVNLVDSAKKLGADISDVNTDTLKSNWTVEALTSGIPASDFTSSLTDADNKGGMEFEIVSYSVDADGKTVTLALPGVVNDDNYKYDNNTTLAKFNNKINSYTLSGGSMLADDNTVFFIYNATKDNYSVITGVKNLSSSNMDIGTFDNENSNQNDKQINALGYFNSSASTVTAKAIVVQNADTDAYVATSNYAYIIGDLTKIGDDLYTYPVVLDNGTVDTLTTKDNSFTAGTVIAYSLDSNGYAVEDSTIVVNENVTNNDNGIYNGYVVETASGSSIDFKSGYNGAVNAQFVANADVAMYDVENAEAGNNDSVTTVSTLGKGQSTCFVVEDGNVKYIFVDDNNAVFADVKNSTGNNLSDVNGAPLADDGTMSVASGYTVTVDGATNIAYNYTVSGQTYNKTTSANTVKDVFTMPANTTEGVEITTATGANTYAYYTLTLPTAGMDVNGATVSGTTTTIVGGTPVEITGLTDDEAYTVDNGTTPLVVAGSKISFNMPAGDTELKQMVAVDLGTISGADATYSADTVYAMPNDAATLTVEVTGVAGSKHDKLVFTDTVSEVGTNLVDAGSNTVIVDKAATVSSDNTFKVTVANVGTSYTKTVSATCTEVFKVNVPGATTAISGLDNATVAWEVNSEAATATEDYYLETSDTVVATVSLGTTGFTTGKANAELTTSSATKATAAITTDTNEPTTSDKAMLSGTDAIQFPTNSQNYKDGVFTFTWTVASADINDIGFTFTNS